MIRCFHGFYLSIREDAWRRPSDEAVQDRTGTCRAGEDTRREPSREPAAMHAASSSLPSESGLSSEGHDEPSGQGRFVTKRSLAGVRRYGKLEGSIVSSRRAKTSSSLEAPLE